LKPNIKDEINSNLSPKISLITPIKTDFSVFAGETQDSKEGLISKK